MRYDMFTTSIQERQLGRKRKQNNEIIKTKR
jgi:hypothetical protein